jgi:hypothetical protein
LAKEVAEANAAEANAAANKKPGERARRSHHAGQATK